MFVFLFFFCTKGLIFRNIDTQKKTKKNISITGCQVNFFFLFFLYFFLDSDVKFKSGKAVLLVHSETGKHITSTKKKINSVKHQITIGESLQASQDKDEEDVRLEKKRREFEISLSRSLSNHKVPFQFLKCLQDQLKKYCGDTEDSEVVKRMKLSRYKGEVILRHRVGKTYQDETVRLLQKCDAFSVK